HNHVLSANTEVVVHTKGTFHLGTNGHYTYDVNEAALNALSVSESTTDTIHYTMHDQYGLTSTADIVITLHGANDAPTAVADATGAREAGYTVSGSTTGYSATG